LIGRHIAHAQLAAGHGGDRDERSDLDVVRTDAMPRRVELADAVDLEDVAADPRDPRAHCVQRVAEPLDVRLRGRVEQSRAPLGRRGRHHGGLGAGDARLVQEHLGAPEAAAELQVIVGVVEGDARAELAEREQVSVEPAAADLVAARPGQHGEPRPREQRRGEKERRPDLRGQRGVGARLAEPRGIDRDCVLPRPIDGDPEGADELDQRVDVADAGHVLDADAPGREERRRQQRQRLVLVAARRDVPADGMSALDHEAVAGRGARGRHRSRRTTVPR
jgi:hypothetical protein